MKTEKEKMLTGEMYDASCESLTYERDKCHNICREFNSITKLDKIDIDTLLNSFGKVGNNCHIESPFFCDYGYNIELGNNVYFNFNVTILDCAKVKIGDNVKFGPGVQVYTAGHSLEPVSRADGDEFALPITIEDNVWIGGSSIILPNITIGKNAVIGAGSVVTKDIPANSIVCGNPAKSIKQS